jgi:tetratricopeptide (TPR) repeat protein
MLLRRAGVFAATLTLLVSAAVAAIPSEVAAAAEATLERAHLRGDAELVRRSLQPVDAALAAAPDDPALLYTRAFGHYALLASMWGAKNKRAMEAEIDRAIELLDRVRGEPWATEATAMKSHLLGQLMAVRGGMLSAMKLGPKSGKLIAEAAAIAPGNPRILWFQGMSLLNTPAMFGGDPAKARALLQQSVAAFAAATADGPGPHWGRADALTWLGIAQQKAGDPAAARSAWEQALALEPEYGWVKNDLLPSLPAAPTVR